MDTGYRIIMNVSKVLWRAGAVLGLAGLAMLIAGCQTKPARSPFAELPGVTTPAAGTPAGPAAGVPAGVIVPAAAAGATNAPAAGPSNPIDIIQVGESLTITFTDLPMIQPPIQDRVKQDGTITLIQNQTFVAAGKTRRELEVEIRERYVPQYFKYMTVAVTPDNQTRFYFVGGEVKTPGRQIYLGPMTVLKAIQSCGDFTDFAKQRAVELTRADGRKFTVNCKQARKDPTLDLEVYPGDKIHVPRTIW